MTRGAAQGRFAAALLALLFAALLGLAGAARAQSVPRFPAFTGLVVDAANVIPADQKAALTAKLAGLQQRTGRQLVVATIPDLQGYPIEDYGYQLLRTWGVGLKSVNNGTILIVAPNERKVRVEVGYGLEPVLTDAFSSVIVNTQILPRFKAGDLPGGIMAGADALIAQLALPDAEAKAKLDAAVAAYDKEHRRAAHGGGGGIPMSLIFWGIVLAFIVLSMLRRSGGGRRYGGSGWPIFLWGPGLGGGWGGGGSSWGGGSSGGFGGFGGGDSGGGGGWMGGGFTGGGGGSAGGGGASGGW